MSKRAPNTKSPRARAKDEPRPRDTPTQLARPVVDEQVRVVADLMTRSEWDESRADALAAQWGISGIAMRDRTAQAARFVRLLADPAQREQLRVRWLAVLDGIAMGALEPRDQVAAIREGRELGMLGAAVTKVEVTQRSFSQMTEAEQLAQLRTALPRMADALAQLEAKERAGLLGKGEGDG